MSKTERPSVLFDLFDYLSPGGQNVFTLYAHIFVRISAQTVIYNSSAVHFASMKFVSLAFNETALKKSFFQKL